MKPFVLGFCKYGKRNGTKLSLKEIICLVSTLWLPGPTSWAWSDS